MEDLRYMICPQDHAVAKERWNYARDFSDRDVDIMSLEPLFEGGLYCHGCDRAYGLSKLRNPPIESNQEKRT